MLVIVQARLNSKRFKKKVLYHIKDKPIIKHVVDRLKKSKFKNDIVVATSKNKFDDRLVEYLKFNKIKYFRGSLKNVAMRLFNAANLSNNKKFVRISADSPLIDSKIMDKMIKLSRDKRFKSYDIITNVFPRTFPKGLSVEIIKTELLKKYLNKMNKDEKEHVTKYFYKFSQIFKIKNLNNFNKRKYRLNCAIDTFNDLKKVKKLMNSLKIT